MANNNKDLLWHYSNLGFFEDESMSSGERVRDLDVDVDAAASGTWSASS